MPWQWKRGKSIQKLQSALSHWFEGEVVLFASGRESLLALLKSLNAPTSSEVIIQGYTCVALPNAIHAAGLTPVYVDINPDTLNMDIEAVRANITPRTKAIICQHTFGIPADTEALRELANQHGLLLIEDCAHCIPDVTGPKILGKHADAIMLSFGRDKAISGVAGGAIVLKNTDLAIQPPTNHLSIWTIQRLLLYPLIYTVSKPFIPLYAGKIILAICRMLRLLVPVLTEKEKLGFSKTTLHAMPNACCALALLELQSLHTINNHRRMLMEIYNEQARIHHWKMPRHLSADLPLQKYPIYTKNADQIRRALKKKHIYLDDGWTDSAICPSSVSMEACGYTAGSCPNAENVAAEILTLPTHPTMHVRHARRLSTCLSSLLSS